MLTKRIIPCLDIDNGRVVKGINFLALKDAGDPVELAKLYYQQGADELIFLDITASNENRNTTVKLVKKVARELFIPFTVGGGIRSVEDMRKILLAGADKVSLNTAAFNNPRLISDGAKVFGSQCIVVAIDVKKNKDKWEVYISGGRTPTKSDVFDWVKQAVKLGAGEILLTSMDRDGMRIGFDCELVKQVSSCVNVPVIASGGAGKKEDFAEVFKLGKADAVLAASLFHFGELKVREVKNYLIENQIEVRI